MNSTSFLLLCIVMVVLLLPLFFSGQRWYFASAPQLSIAVRQ